MKIVDTSSDSVIYRYEIKDLQISFEGTDVALDKQTTHKESTYRKIRHAPFIIRLASFSDWAPSLSNERRTLLFRANVDFHYSIGV